MGSGVDVGALSMLDGIELITVTVFTMLKVSVSIRTRSDRGGVSGAGTLKRVSPSGTLGCVGSAGKLIVISITATHRCGRGRFRNTVGVRCARVRGECGRVPGGDVMLLRYHLKVIMPGTCGVLLRGHPSLGRVSCVGNTPLFSRCGG